MATKLVQDPGNGSPRIPEGQPSIYASQEEWAAYRQKQAADQEASAALLRSISSQNAALSNPTMIQMAGPGESLQDVLNRLAGPASPTFTDSSGLDAMASLIASVSGVSTTPAKGNVATNGMYPKVGAGKPSQEAAPVAESTANSLLMGAFPEAFLKSPPKGVANTKGGADRVNAFTSEHGVKAITDEKGNVTLTNIGVPKGTLTGNVANTMPNVPMGVQASMKFLNDPNTTVDAALGHYQDINLEIATQQARIQGEAIRFAETEFGIPDLNMKLQQSLIADQNSPSWYPGIGDSPVTIRIRDEIRNAQSVAQVKAQNYLKNNTSYAALEVSKNSALLALRQNEARNNRKETLNDRAAQQVITDARRLEDKKEMDLAQRAQVGATLSPEQMDRILTVQPNLANLQGQEQLAQMGDTLKRTASDNEMKQYLGADAIELPTMAISGNSYALTYLKGKEKKLGRNDAEIDADINSVKDIASRKGVLENAIKEKYKGVAGGDRLIQEENVALSKARLSPKSKEELIRFALDAKQQQTALAPVGDITRLKGAEFGLLGPVIAEARKRNKSNSVSDLLTIFLEGASGGDRLGKVDIFRQEIMKLTNAQPPSVFGMPNGAALQQAIVEASKEGNSWFQPITADRAPAWFQNTLGPVVQSAVN